MVSEVRRFEGKQYFLGNAYPFRTKRRARKSAKIYREMGQKVRIVRVKRGYNIYFKK